MNNYANWELTQLLPKNENPTGWWYKEIKESSEDFIVLNLPPNIGYYSRKHRYIRFRNLYSKRNFFKEYIADKCLLTKTIDTDKLAVRGIKIISTFKYIDKSAWTWEDIRLYLESKGFSININHYALQEIPYWCHVVNSIERNSYDIGKFDTYEQAREEAIKWCLTKINSDEKTQKTSSI